ncbi:hypothetical protein [Thalassospira sp. A3_1]|uniref:hypothetical protein n=1 Tax=Thalassospira sp. A3_1 TaxID=2821088 RepID=UPI001ADA66BD|nr:hypothetical protein [Thalassospira sp. A3_1]MBO9509088.1 hypothetical protein [Thalassospira sp. A3_1]
MTAPLDKIINWIKDLPPTQQLDVVFLISPMPGLNIDIHSDQMVNEFMDQISQLRASKLREMALVFCLKTLIENNIISKRASAESWKEIKFMLNHLAEEKDNDTFAKMATRKEFEGAQWVNSCMKWKKMAAENLSPADIEHYYFL